MDEFLQHSTEISAPQASQRQLSSLCLCLCTCAARGSLLDKVSQLTVAYEGAFGVLAVAVETDVLVQITLIHIWTVIDREI